MSVNNCLQQTITAFYVADQESAQLRDLYLNKLPLSGYSLVNRIDPSAHILDVGCGQNLFKKYFHNLVGIDPATNEADIKVTIQDYLPDRQFDVALCLGSIQGDDTAVRQQIIKIHNLLAPNGKIYWRCMPDPPPSVVPSWMSLWTFERHRNLSRELGFTIVELEWDVFENGSRRSPRIYSQWQRST